VSTPDITAISPGRGIATIAASSVMAVMTMIECPNHGGGFDCTPFCPVCEGEQEYAIGE